MVQTENLLAIVKETLTTSIRSNTHKGYIGWSSCDNICMDMHDCLDLCEDTFKLGNYKEALEVSTYILVSGVKLASHADSSSGMLTDVVMRSFELIGKYAKRISTQDKQIRDEALTFIIKESKKKAFDGWIEWRYELLRCGICLCDGESAKKMEKILDVFLESAEQDYYPEYEKQKNLVIRYFLHRELHGKEAVKDELYKNINIQELRILAISDALEEKDYGEAERLCGDKAKKEEGWHYRRNDPEDWNNILFRIYEKSGNVDKQIAQAKKILFLGNESFWDVLKEIYSKEGIWETQRVQLLEKLKNSGKAICYRSVLVKENEKKRLLNDLTENPFDIFYYGQFLVMDYPEQIYVLCVNDVKRSCAQATDRRMYRKVCKDIKQLIKWKGSDYARELIAELKQAYPRRPALIDELEKVESKL